MESLINICCFCYSKLLAVLYTLIAVLCVQIQYKMPGSLPAYTESSGIIIMNFIDPETFPLHLCTFISLSEKNIYPQYDIANNILHASKIQTKNNAIIILSIGFLFYLPNDGS